MKIPFKIQDKKFLLEPYRTYQEKEILLLSTFDVDDFNRIFEILNFKTEYDLSPEEKKIILYKFREISVGDEIEINFKCPKCGMVNDGAITADNFIINAERNDSDIKKIIKEVTDDNIGDFVNIEVDELDIQEYEELKERIIKNQIKFNFIRTVKCLKCKTEKKYDISSMKYIIEIMSDDTLMSLYKTYNHLIYFSHYTKNDIDNMLPFERTIFKGLLNKTREDLAK